MFPRLLRKSLLVFLLTLASTSSQSNDSGKWIQNFDLSECSWSSIGRNDFFILEPGYQLVLQNPENQHSTRLEVTVLNETKKVGSVETRVVEERESRNGEIKEISRNYFAVCLPAKDIYYFGEDTQIYRNGKMVGQEDSWLAGKAGAKPGLFLSSNPSVGARYYQELAPGVAMDRVEIVSNTVSLKTAAGEFHDCLKIEETTPLEPNEKEYKIYAKEVGVIQDEELLLIKYGKVDIPEP